MAGIINTIYMGITRLAALVTMSDDVFRDPLSQPFIKYEVFTDKFILKVLFLRLIAVMNNAPFQVEYIFEAMVKHKGRGFLAADASGAIHDDILILLILH